jgi:hypothetical protein
MPRRAPKLIALAILALAWAALAAGCVSIPIPPSDMGTTKAGELGTLKLRVAVEYKPNWAGTVQAGLRQWSGGGKETVKPIR